MEHIAGYGFLYSTSVVRPGEQIRTNINPSHVPALDGGAVGPAAPTFGFHGTEFSAQGANAGYAGVTTNCKSPFVSMATSLS